MAITSKRQPLSCENCRKRKIKCTGQKKPCDTCVRRGFSHTCFYARQSNPSLSNADVDEVLQRLARVESLLELHGGGTSRSCATYQNRRPQMPHDQLSPADTSISAGSGSTPSTQSTTVVQGTILTLPGGYQRFVPGLSSSDASAVNELLQSASRPSSTTLFPFSTESMASKQSLLNALPPASQCEELKAIFFESFSPLFHLLHDPTFHTEYTKFRQNPAEVSLSFLALLFVILSIAVTALDDGHPLLTDLGLEASTTANIKSLAGRYRAAAMKCLSADQFLWQHTIHTVQALILLIYAINHAYGPSWALLGTTFNISVAIGCHIDPSHLNLSLVQSEIRRRCWASLMMLYTIQNTCLGNIAPQKFLAQVNLPADLDDEEINGCANRQVNPGVSNLTPPTKMSYVLYKFRLYQIAAEICESAQGVEPDFNKVLSLESRILSEEDDHSVRFSHHENFPIYHLAHHCILKNYTNHLRLILHRPFLLPDFVSPSNHARPKDEVLQSRQLCKRAAITILENHEQLYRIDAFKPYRWYIYGLGSFHAFLAASTLIILLKTDLVDTTDFSQSNVVSLLHDCQNRFQAMAPRSEICAKAAPILSRLLPSSSARDGRNSALVPGSRVGNAVGIHSASVFSNSGNEQTMYASNSSNSNRLSTPEYDFNSYLPQLQNLVELPAAQWLGGPSAFTWSDWNFSPDSSMMIHDASGSFLIGAEGLL